MTQYSPNLARILSLFCVIGLTAGIASADQQVRLTAKVPATTPETADIFLAGSLPSVGGWKADGLKLTRQPDGTYATNLSIPVGQTLEFKFTRGNWSNVEKYADGSDRPNRQLTIKADTKQFDAKVDRWGDDAPTQQLPGTVVGNLKLHTLDSQHLKQSRAIRVWLPPGYNAASTTRYPVLYMHDGQNCFNRATAAFGNEWKIDETLTKLISEKRIPPIIVVAIDNGGANRINELTYDADATRGGGQCATYADFLLREVKPFVDKTYRTRPEAAHTFLGGSSLGGLAALDIPRRHPDTFAGVIAMSPTLGWADQAMLKQIEANPGGLGGTSVWVDMGTQEAGPPASKPTAEAQNQKYISLVQNLDQALTRHHVVHRLVLDEDHPGHNEPAWASRFPQAIEYILKAK